VILINVIVFLWCARIEAKGNFCTGGQRHCSDL
jgi:hypothetical protein